MAKKKDDIPDWVSDEIQNAKFEKPEELKKTGYILEFYDVDNKLDVQLYDPVEDGRHIVTMDLPKKTKIDDLVKGEVYEFVFDQHKAPISKKASEYLDKEKEIEIPMKMDSATKHFICKRCGLYATREQVSDIRYKLNQREKTREDKHDDYLEWWSKSKKEKAEN